MEFGILNVFGGITVVLMLIPNVIYGMRNPDLENKCRNFAMNLLEQLGRYGAMVLMILPVGVWKFGFPSVADMLTCLFGTIVLLLAYWACWLPYFRNPSPKLAITMAVLPTCLFLLWGITLRHWLLVLTAAVFGVGHIYVTKENVKK